MAHKKPNKNNSRVVNSPRTFLARFPALLKTPAGKVLSALGGIALIALGTLTDYGGVAVSQTSARNAASSNTYQLTGLVSHVPDGDTINLTVGGQRQRIRLASIDAPETAGRADRPGQPYAQQSQQALSHMVANKTLTLRCYTKDQYDRHVCDVLLPGQNQTANQLMVSQGWAWAYTAAKGRYLYDQRLRTVQRQAKRQGKGLWQGANPKAPWQWRYDCWQQKKCD